MINVDGVTVTIDAGLTATCGSLVLGNGTNTVTLAFTKDSTGNYCGRYVAPKLTRRGTIGDVIAGGPAALVIESWMQVTRTEDGSKIFYSWTDTDTSATGWSILDDNKGEIFKNLFITTGNDLMSDSKMLSVDDNADFMQKNIIPKQIEYALLGSSSIQW